MENERLITVATEDEARIRRLTAEIASLFFELSSIAARNQKPSSFSPMRLLMEYEGAESRGVWCCWCPEMGMCCGTSKSTKCSDATGMIPLRNG